MKFSFCVRADSVQGPARRLAFLWAAGMSSRWTHRVGAEANVQPVGEGQCGGPVKEGPVHGRDEQQAAGHVSKDPTRLPLFHRAFLH